MNYIYNTFYYVRSVFGFAGAPEIRPDCINYADQNTVDWGRLYVCNDVDASTNLDSLSGKVKPGQNNVGFSDNSTWHKFNTAGSVLHAMQTVKHIAIGLFSAILLVLLGYLVYANICGYIKRKKFEKQMRQMQGNGERNYTMCKRCLTIQRRID